MTNHCKRCGDVGHYAKRCPFPPLRRPDLERIRDRINGLQSRGARKMHRDAAIRAFDVVFKYVEDLEAARRSLLTEMQRRLAA